jgi:peptide/nickel transport system permease protein
MTFKTFVAKKILLTVLVFFIITMVIFLIVRSAPGDPILTIYGKREGVDFPPEYREYLKHLYGLDQPLPIQYLHWIWGVLHGDLGRSYVYREPVTTVLFRAVWNTLKLQLVGTLLAVVIAVPVGVISAVKQYSKIDYVMMTGSLLLWSLPWFWYGMMLILIFSVGLGWFPSFGVAPPGTGGTWIEQIQHAILPIVVLSTATSGFLSRVVRSSMLEVLRQDYILVARAKGLKERVVIYRHALRNALLPLVTVVGLYFGIVLGGAATIETVFAWPGCGLLIVQAATYRDYTLVMGTALIVTLSVMISVAITDIIYGYLDPRIRVG